MSSNSELVLVTGASGFLGSAVVDQLLDQGYKVRAIARGGKVEELRQRNVHFGDRFTAVDISNIVTDQFPEALKGVDAVIHTASPLPFRADKDEMLTTAVEGTLNVLRQAEEAGVKKLVVTSSIASVVNPGGTFTDKDWNPLTKEQAVTPFDIYIVAKTNAERKLWEFAENHPDLDITTLNPPFFYGPFSKSFSLPTPNYGALSTNLQIYRMLTTNGVFPPLASYMDIRDVARAHVLALKALPSSQVGMKRLPIASPYDFKPAEIIAYIAEQRPELKDRLIDASRAPPYAFYRIPLDFQRVEEVLGFKQSEFHGWQDTVLSAVDALIAVENAWKAKGLEIDIPLE